MQANSGKTIWISILITAIILSFISYQRLDSNSTESNNKNAADAEFSKKEIKIPIKLATVTTEKFSRSISAYGKVEAFQSAFVTAKVSGTIENIFVDEGSMVKKGITSLFESDNLKLRQKVENARENIPVVLAVEKERRALLKKAQIDYDKKLKTFNRFKTLFNNKAVSQEVFDNHEASLQTAEAEVEHKKALLELGQAEARQAKINLEMAQKDLADSIVLAPIDGIVSEKLIEIGEMGQPGKPAFRIDNIDKVYISAFIPAEYCSDISAGQTIAEISLNGEVLIPELEVTYVSPLIDSKLHIFEIKCLINENTFALKPGQSLQLRLFCGKKSTITVPTGALVESLNESSLVTVQNGRARFIRVKKGAEFNGRTEILEPSLPPDSQVICEGQILLKENSAVTIIE